MKGGPRPGSGRKRKPIDLAELEKLCILQCTQEEIAAFFGVSVPTIELSRKRSPEFKAIMENGYHKGKISVRRKQMQLLEAGSNTMAVWLGKQLLGQRDKNDIVVGGGGSPVDVNVGVGEEILSILAGIRARRSPAGSS